MAKVEQIFTFHVLLRNLPCSFVTIHSQTHKLLSNILEVTIHPLSHNVKTVSDSDKIL